MPEIPVFPRGLLPTEAVIVTDGNERSALAVVRALGARGVSVYVGAETSSSLAGASRYCRGGFVYPSPWTHPQEYLASLLDHACQFHAGLIFPMTDVAVEILGEYQQGGGKEFTLPIPSLADYQALSNKFQLMEWAKKAEIPIPATLFLHGRHDLESALDKIHRWPVVVKPGRSLIKDGALWKKTAVAMASDRDALQQLYQERWYLKWPSLIQEQVTGYGEGVFSLFVEGKPAVLFAHRRLREKPPSGGVSVLRESIPLPPAMIDYATRIMQSVTWQGVAMVEFKVASDTGVPYLMEVNGRFWGSLQLAIDAGIDFPWLLYQLVTSGSVQPLEFPYKVGVRSQWWLGDLDHLLIRVQRRDMELNLPPGTPSKVQTIKSLLNPFERGSHSEVWRADDRGPGRYELVSYLRNLVPPHNVRRQLTALRLLCLRFLWKIGVACGVHRWFVERCTRVPIRNILVLCKGNICRSPFAAEYLRSKARQTQVSVEVLSAGLDTNAGEPADHDAQLAATKFGVLLAHHRTAVVTGDMVAKADLIVVMELRHHQMLLESFPEARAKTCLLGHFSSPATTEIFDPYGGDLEVFFRSYSTILGACDCLLKRLLSA